MTVQFVLRGSRTSPLLFFIPPVLTLTEGGRCDRSKVDRMTHVIGTWPDLQL